MQMMKKVGKMATLLGVQKPIQQKMPIIYNFASIQSFLM